MKIVFVMRKYILFFLAIAILAGLFFLGIFVFKNNLITKLTADLTGSYTITASATSDYGGVNAPSKGINYLSYMFVGCPTPANRESWVSLLKILNIHLAQFFLCFVGGDFTPVSKSPQNLKDTVAYFKANSISVAMHDYSDLISPSSQLAKDTRNIKHNSDGAMMTIYGRYVPTPAASLVIAKNLANAYNYYGFNGGIFFDAIDWYKHSDLISNPEAGSVFINEVIKNIPGGSPMDGAATFSQSDQLFSRHSLPGGIDTPRIDLRQAADKRAAAVSSSSSPTVPFMGWLAVPFPSWLKAGTYQTYTVSDLEYHLAKGQSVGASYAIEELSPTNYNKPDYAPFVSPLIKYNAKWNMRVITAQDANSAPLFGATIQVIDTNGAVVFSGTTNSKGYIVGNLGALNGPYTIKTQYNSKTQTDTNSLTSLLAMTEDTKIIFNPAQTPISTPTTNGLPTLNTIARQSVVAGQALAFTLSPNNPASGQTFIYTARGLPEGSTFNTNTGVFNWTPTADQQGSYAITFSLYTNNNFSDTKEAIITVTSSSATTAPNTATPQIPATTPLTANALAPLTEYLFYGMRSVEVKTLQKMLLQDASISSGLQVTGVYDDQTRYVVQRFQQKYSIAGPGISGYGITGPKTRAKLNQLYSSGTAAAATPLSPTTPTATAQAAADKAALIAQLKAQLMSLLQQLIVLMQEQIKNLIINVKI